MKYVTVALWTSSSRTLYKSLSTTNFKIWNSTKELLQPSILSAWNIQTIWMDDPNLNYKALLTILNCPYRAALKRSCGHYLPVWKNITYLLTLKKLCYENKISFKQNKNFNAIKWHVNLCMFMLKIWSCNYRCY